MHLRIVRADTESYFALAWQLSRAHVNSLAPPPTLPPPALATTSPMRELGPTFAAGIAAPTAAPIGRPSPGAQVPVVAGSTSGSANSDLSQRLAEFRATLPH